MGIVEVLEISGGRSPLIIEDLDVYPQLPDATGAPTLNSEEPLKGFDVKHVQRRTALVALAGLAVLGAAPAAFAEVEVDEVSESEL